VIRSLPARRLANRIGHVPAVRLVKPVLLGLSIATAIVVWILWYGGGSPRDAMASYNPIYGNQDTPYLWTPAFAQLTAPLRLLSFDDFVAVIRGLEIAAIVAMVPYAAWIVLFLPPVAAEVNAANINMLLILAVITSIRYPAAWVLPMLTKPSLGLALTWFAARGEWRKVRSAAVPTLAIVAVSVAISPAAWVQYLQMLLAFADTPGWPFPIPIWPRIPIAIAIAIVGRRYRWALPLAAIVGMPRLYFISIAMLIGLVPMLRRGPRIVIVPSTSPAAGQLDLPHPVAPLGRGHVLVAAGRDDGQAAGDGRVHTA
jgi:hypothetical protein